MEKFIILCWYEYWTKKGKDWCKWYVQDSKPRTLEDAKQGIESLKSSYAQTARITKLKYEFKFLPIKNLKKIRTSFGIFSEQ